jgi:lysosomal acid lipase/cholesteryl ester hydrolase
MNTTYILLITFFGIANSLNIAYLNRTRASLGWNIFGQGLERLSSIAGSIEDAFSALFKEDEPDIASAPEDADLNMTELATKYGYPIEQHTVTTEDNYIINIHRIPYGKRETNATSNAVVFLMHGIIDSSDCWLLQGPGKALAYILADQGFDVWMGNARGNKYALNHTKFSPNQSDFWGFTWEEIGKYDLPAMIDYVLNVTGKESLYYVGYSQGTTIFYVMTSMKPEYNDKIKMMFQLAPIAWLSHMRSPILNALSLAPNFIVSFLLDSRMASTDFLSSLPTICTSLGLPCDRMMYLTVGNSSQMLPDILPIVFGHMPTSASTLQLVHYGQLVNSGRFSRFDHGFERNMQLYGTESTPDYDLRNITTPIVSFYSDNDWISVPEDVKILEKYLNVIDSRYIMDYNHLDFVYGDNAKDVIYSQIVEHIHKMENLN